MGPLGSGRGVLACGVNEVTCSCAIFCKGNSMLLSDIFWCVTLLNVLASCSRDYCWEELNCMYVT